MYANVSFKVSKIVMVVAVLGAAASQGAFAQTCTSFQRSVPVTISTVGNAASVSPDTACVAKHGTVKWTANDGETWSTDFTDDAHSPFAAGKRHHEGKVHKPRGDKVRVCSQSDPSFDSKAGGCLFKFKATHVKGGKPSTIDPQVVIQPGT